MPQRKKQSARTIAELSKLRMRKKRFMAEHGIEIIAPTKGKKPVVRCEDWSPEAQERIRCLKVKGLRDFLKFAGSSTDGRMQTLINRILTLPSRTEQEIKDKLEEIYVRETRQEARNARKGETEAKETPSRKRKGGKMELRPKKKRMRKQSDEIDQSEDEKRERATKQQKERMRRQEERTRGQQDSPAPTLGSSTSIRRSIRTRQSREDRSLIRTHVSEGCSTELVSSCNSNGESDTGIPNLRPFRLAAIHILPPANASTEVGSSSNDLPNVTLGPNCTDKSSSNNRNEVPAKPPQLGASHVASVEERLTVENGSEPCSIDQSCTSQSTPTESDCVKMKDLPFFDVLEVVQDATTLVRKPGRKGNTAVMYFHLSPLQADTIARSRTTILRLNGSCSANYSVNVLLRFALQDTSVEQGDELPLNMTLNINGKSAPLPGPLPRRRLLEDIRRPGRPIDITSLLNLSPKQANVIGVSWSGARILPYVWSLLLVRGNTSDVLLERLQSARIPPDVTRRIVVKKVGEEGDSDLTVSSGLRVSLLCPISKQRMKCAVKKASGCDHVQCWDALTFLKMNERKPTWRCPVCNAEAQFKHLAVDNLVQEILDRTGCDVTGVEFLRDGSWKPLNATHQLSHSSLTSDTDSSACHNLRSQQPVLKGTDFFVNLADDDDDDSDS